MAFGIDDLSSTAQRVPQVDGGNVPVSNIQQSDLGFGQLQRTLSQGLDDLARKKADRDLGVAIGDAIDVYSTSITSGKSPVELTLERDRIISSIGRTYGAKAITAAKNILDDVGQSKFKATYDNGNIMFTDNNGNVIGTRTLGDYEAGRMSFRQEEQNVDPEAVRKDIITNELVQLDVAAPAFSTAVNDFIKSAGIPIGSQESQQMYNISNKALNMFGTIQREVERIGIMGRNPISTDVLNAVKQEGRNNILGSVATVMNELSSNDLILQALRNTDNPLTPEMMGQFARTLVTDISTYLQETGAYTALGINPVEFNASINSIVGKVQEGYTAAFGGKVELINRAKNELKGTVDAEMHGWLLGLEPEERQRINYADQFSKLAGAMQSLDNMTNLYSQWGAAGATARITSYTRIGQGASLWKVFISPDNMSQHFSSPTSLRTFVKAINTFINTEPALMHEIIPWVVENKDKFKSALDRFKEKNPEEEMPNLEDIFNDAQYLDTILEESIRSTGFSRSEIRAILQEGGIFDR